MSRPAPQAAVVSVTGERFGLGESLSPTVRRSVLRAVRAIAIVHQAKAWGPTDGR